jgi:hypothetical protein
MQYKYAEEESIEDFLLCPICSEPFDEPIDHTDCGQTFCKKCIQPLKSCPMCRGNINNIQITSKVIRGLLDNLKVCCIFVYFGREINIILNYIYFLLVNISLTNLLFLSKKEIITINFFLNSISFFVIILFKYSLFFIILFTKIFLFK